LLILLPVFTMWHPASLASQSCVITGMEIGTWRPCYDSDTQPDWTDDYYLANFKIFHTGANEGDIVEVIHSHLLYQPPEHAPIDANEAANGISYLWSNKMQTDINVTDPVPGWVNLGTFTINITDKDGNFRCGANFTFSGSGKDNSHVKPCSVCTVNYGQWNSSSYTSCWPNEIPAGPCDDPLNYAPDPASPEHTSLRYVKVILHVLQVEDPDNPGNPHPIDPQNYYSNQHVDLFRSWFTSPEGVNGKMANLCAADADNSPHIPDSRIRFVLDYGEEGKDIFFHANNQHWGISSQDCGNGTFPPNPASLKSYYITSPASPPLSTDYVNWIMLPEQQNAFHVFISGGHWEDLNSDGQPDPTDCFNFATGGYLYPSESNCQNNPVQYIMGNYNQYLKILNQQSNDAPESLGNQITGEFFHVLTVDHLSPFQIHYQHDIGVDGCEDTSLDQDSNNLLGCDYDHDGGRCHLTQCQLGRMHRYFETVQPAFERFLTGYEPDGTPVFSMTDRNCNLVDPDIVIKDGETVTWNSPRSLRSNVIVQSGGKLYIKCRVGLPEGARITVQTNGRLYLYGEIYNNCDGKLWEGVVVNGNSDQPQGFPPTNQGYFVLHNGSIIEGANTSIRVESGGMVIGIGADIRNSGGMLFEPYSFPQKGWFSGCNFTCDGNIYDFGGNPFKHAGLHAVNNVRFGGCNFSVSNVPAGQLSKMAGIVADGSMFRVTSGSTFRGFDTGIHAAGQFSPVNAFTVNGCTFSNNQTGIFALGMQNFTVTDNTFEVGGADFQANSPSGLMMDNCTGYTVEENTFYGTDDVATGRFGIVTEDSGDDANLIRGNSFDHLEYANSAQGDNRGLNEGLQYHCNDNLGNNLHDFYVPGGFKQQGIHINQGNGKAAMNTFSHLGAFVDGDFRNEVGVIQYYHKDDPAHEPQNPTGVNKFFVDDENTCPEDEIPCPFPCHYTLAEWQQTESDFQTARSGWQTEKASLLALMDGGDSGALLAEINGATSQNAGQVTQHLLNLSPWLSTQALTATINQKQVLTESATVQILNANPEGLREAEVRELVQASFSQMVAGAILENASTQTARTAKEILVGQHRATMLRKADLLIQDILKDTTQIDVPLLRTWLANKQSLEADYAIVASYLSEGDFVTASQKLDEIAQTYSLDAEGLIEHGYFNDLASLWQDAYSNGKTMAELDSQGVATVKNIAGNSRRRAGAMAQGIVNTWYGGQYRVVPILPGSGGSQGLMAPPAGSNIVPMTNHLSAFPNPARNSVVFRWNLPEGMENGTILLSDLQGRTIETLEITGQKGKLEWGTEVLEHGVYLYQLRLPDGSSETSKLTIIK
jgi:Periplasmic copper-binding protein (NosD)